MAKSELRFVNSRYTKADGHPLYEAARGYTVMLIDFYGSHPIGSRTSGKQLASAAYPVLIPQGTTAFWFNPGSGTATNPRLTARVAHWDASQSVYIWDVRETSDIPLTDGDNTIDLSSYNDGTYYLLLNYTSDGKPVRVGALGWRYGFR